MFLILVFLSSVLGSCFALFCLRCLSRLVVCVYARVYPRYLWRMQLSAIVLFVFSFFVFRFFFDALCHAPAAQRSRRNACRLPTTLRRKRSRSCAASSTTASMRFRCRIPCRGCQVLRRRRFFFFPTCGSCLFPRSLCRLRVLLVGFTYMHTHTLHSATVLSAVQGL